MDNLFFGCYEDFPNICPFPADFSILIEITNTGITHASDFVALAFVTSKYRTQPYPIKQLAAYTRLKGIDPQETRCVELDIKV
jgi:beta-D-xylosidase 4